MAKCFLSEQQLKLIEPARGEPQRIATLRVYVSATTKRAIAVKEDDIMTKAEIQANPIKVSKALYTELRIWYDKACFKMQLLSNAKNVMTSRYVYK